jgi:hypothetical protein
MAQTALADLSDRYPCLFTRTSASKPNMCALLRIWFSFNQLAHYQLLLLDGFRRTPRRAITSTGDVFLALAITSGHNSGSMNAAAPFLPIQRIDSSEISQAYTQPTVCLPSGPISRAMGDASSLKWVTI